MASTNALLTSQNSDAASDAYPLFAQPNKSGFFGLSALRQFASTALEPYSKIQDDVKFILDFSLVRVWDIAALLWLTVGLNHYRQKGFQFLLRLPEPHRGLSTEDCDAITKSADYLRRWRFDVALRNVHADPTQL